MSISRRHFIMASVTASGGMMLGFQLPATAKAAPFEPHVTGTQELNAWLVIEPDDVITIRVAQAEMGQGVFTSMAMLVAEELEVDWRQVRAEYADANRHIRENRIYGRMATGGSSAVRRSREYLQRAGAEARMRLLKAAAELWLVNPDQCRADYGRVYHDPSGRSINYGAIAGAAAGISVGKVAIKPPEDFGLIGLPTRRLDVPAKTDGSAVYGMDVRVPGMLYAAVVHTPIVGGSVRSLRFNAIRNMPGVRKAVRMDSAVAVVADHYWQARTALEALPVEWNFGASGKTWSDTFKKDFVRALDGDGVVVSESGNSTQALDRSEATLSSDYVVPYLAHACMEPINCTVSVTAGRVDVWAGVQNPEAALVAAAEAADVPPEQVYVHNCFLGGGFGRRSHTDFVQEAVLIAKEAGAPVQMIWSREEDMRAGRYRPMAAIRFKVGFDMEKNVTAFTNHSVTHSILEGINPAAVAGGVDPTSVEGLANMPYAFPNRKISHTMKSTHLTTWWWRSVGSSQNAFALECFMDELSVAAKQDPFAYRRARLGGNKAMIDVLDILEEKSNWKTRMPEGAARGMAIHESFGTICGTVAEVSISPGGTLSVSRVVAVVDCGNLVNPSSASMQVESAIVFGLSAVLYGKITVEKGRVLEDNFDTYEVMRMANTPVIETHFALSGGDKWGGLGEPGVPPVAPAVCNAVYAITRRRIRALPLNDYLLTPA